MLVFMSGLSMEDFEFLNPGACRRDRLEKGVSYCVQPVGHV